MMKKAFLLLAFSSLLAGHAATADDIGPGSRQISAETAAKFLVAVCVDQFKNVRQAKRVLAANGFRPSPDTGTFYDNKRDLSFKIGKAKGVHACSMVFTSRAKPVELATMLTVASARENAKGKAAVSVDPETFRGATVSTGGSKMTFRRAGKHDGKWYYHAVLRAK